MRISCLVENLGKNLSILAKTLPVNPPVQVFANLLLEAKKDTFNISAVDGENGTRVRIPAKIEEEGSTTVPGKQFIETITSLPKDKAEILQDKERLSIISRQNNVFLQTAPAGDFPNPFDKKKEAEVVLRKEDVQDIFSKTIFATSSDEARPSLMGVLFVQKEEGVDFVATDGYRLSLYKKAGLKISEENKEIIVSGRLLGEAMLLKTEGGGQIKMSVSSETNQAFFETEDVLLAGRLIGGEFPNYEKAIPSSFKTKAVVQKEDLLQAIRLSSVFAKDTAGVVKIKIEENTLSVFSSAQGVGDSKTGLDIQKEGEDNQISFNLRFLLEFLKSVEDEGLVVELNSGLEPALFRPQKNNSFYHVIMPIRTQEAT